MSEVRIVATGLGFPEGPVALQDGSVIVTEIRNNRCSRITPDGKASLFSATGGGPNGLAVGPDGALYCCNNGGFDWENINPEEGHAPPAPDYTGGTIQRANISTGKVETVLTEYEGRTFGGPNDIMFAPDGSFWFTDFGKWTQDSMRHG